MAAMDEATVEPAALGATHGWEPMSFGRRPASGIANPLFEPIWPGRRTLVEVSAAGVSVRGAALHDHPGAAALSAALAAASLADELLLDGYVVPGPLDQPPAAADVTGASASVTVGAMLRQMFLGSLLRRPQPDAGAPGDADAEPLDPAGQIGFVAVDLLWLDGESLLAVPLGERKRLLEGVLAEGELVRRVVPVRAPVERWHGQWRRFGFRRMAVKGVNSRYLPGGASEDWAIVTIPG
jgi:hypothetical protein